MPSVHTRVETQPPGTDPLALELRVNEIFFSIQGESSRTGLPTAFVRLTGCPLRCNWCDTAYAFDEGSRRSIAEVLRAVQATGATCVTVTGGEPLAQRNCLALLTALCDAGFVVSLETSGALDISGVDARVLKVMDLKAPGSGEEARNRWENLRALAPGDEIKFVLKDRADYEWAHKVIREHGLEGHAGLLFSPVHGTLDPGQLADWILADRLPVRLQVQLHKILWGDVRGR